MSLSFSVVLKEPEVAFLKAPEAKEQKATFLKEHRLRTRRQYQRIVQQPTRYIGRFVIIDTRLSRHSHTKLGITATKHYGIAVSRNRFKRIVREAFRLCRLQLHQGFDINVKPRKSAHLAKMTDILDELVALLGC